MNEPSPLHELFPLDTDEDPEVLDRIASIERIYVRRREPTGKFDYSPMTFEPDALASLEQLFSLFGGGEYILEGRDHSRTYCRVRRLTLPGKPKPLAGPNFEDRPTPAPPVAPVQTPVSDLAVMMQTMTNLIIHQGTQQTAVLTALLTRGDKSNDEVISRHREMEREARENQQTFFRSMLESVQAQAANNAGGAGAQSFMQGVEFMQGMMEQVMANQNAGAESTDFLSSAKSFMEGLGVIANQWKTANGTGGSGGGEPS